MDFQFFGAEKAAVVLDIGSKYTRCGFAGEATPRRIFPTYFKSQNGSKLSLLAFLGTNAESKTQWFEAVENLLHDIYFLYLQCNPRERRVIICENLLSPSIVREALVHVLLEKYQALAITFVPTSVVALVPLLKTTALIVDLGYSETRVIPGLASLLVWSHPKFARRLFSKVLLNKSHFPPLIRPLNSMKISSHVHSTIRGFDYSSVRGNAAGVLLKPTDDDDDEKERDLPTLILQALKQCTGTTRKGLAHQILLLGGGAHTPGLAKALATELNKRLDDNKENPNYKFSELQGLKNHFEFISFAQTCPPSYVGWLGGSIVGTLDQYGQRITKENYRETKTIPDWMSLKNLTIES